MQQQRVRPASEYAAVIFSVIVILTFLKIWFNS